MDEIALRIISKSYGWCVSSIEKNFKDPSNDRKSARTIATGNWAKSFVRFPVKNILLQVVAYRRSYLRNRNSLFASWNSVIHAKAPLSITFPLRTTIRLSLPSEFFKLRSYRKSFWQISQGVFQGLIFWSIHRRNHRDQYCIESSIPFFTGTIAR